MTIKAVTIRPNGETEIHERACFGFLAVNQGSNTRSQYSHIGYKVSAFATLSGNSLRRKILTSLEKILELPMFEEFEFVKTGSLADWYIKAPTTLPADQLILCFFMIRNICQFPRDGGTLHWILENKPDLDVARALILSIMFTRKDELAAIEGEAQRWYRESSQTEPMPLLLHTFGKKALIRFADMNSTNPELLQGVFRQRSFLDQGGYVRERGLLDSRGNRNQVETHISANLTGMVSIPAKTQDYMGHSFSMFPDIPVDSGVTVALTDETFDQYVEQLFDPNRISESHELILAEANMTPEERLQALLRNPIDTDTGLIRQGVPVKLSDTGKGKYPPTPANPHEGVGVIRKILANEGFVYEIEWDNHYINSYKVEDIEISAA